MRATFIGVHGISTRYLQSGAGPAVLLLHGVGAAADNWIRTLDALGERFSCYAPDNLGAGFTDVVDLAGAPPQPRMVAHLIELADALGLERFDIVGHSYGGLLAALIALKHPQRVRRLVLACSASTFLPPAEMRKALERSLAQLGPAGESRELDEFRRRKQKAAFDPASVPEELVYASFIAAARPGRLEFYKATMSGLIASADSAEHRVYSRLEQIAVPTLIVSGADDAGCPPETVAREARRIRSHEHVVFERCGHLPMLEHPARFNQLVTRFLA